MRLEINRLEGLRNDLLLRLERSEVETAQLSIANRERLMALPGMPRHRGATPQEHQGITEAKMPIDEHLRQLGVLDKAGTLHRRAVAISNRNLGTNHGHVAFQRAATPRVFRVLGDPCDCPAYSCLTVWRDGALSIEDLRFDFSEQRVHLAEDGRDVSDEIEWATFGQRVLRRGHVTRIEEIAHQFYDVRHVLAFDPHREEGERIRQDIYRDYPRMFQQNLRRAWSELGVPRARYFHNAIGLSSEALFVQQREGTAEQIGAALKLAGAEDGLILDNGGSVACWVWWANDYAGGTISPTVDYRPPGTSAIAFFLKGPLRIGLPGGSVSPSVL
jgi:hypothetical protein